MRRILPVILVALALGLVQASFVRALPGAASLIDLPLILVIALATGFRFGDAFAAAAASGLAADALSSLPFGVFTAVLLALAVVTVMLVTRVFTHHSLLGTVGINAAVFALSNLLFLVVRVIRATFAGFPALGAADPGTLASQAVAALAWQLVAVALAIAVAGRVRRSFSRFFFLRRDV